MDAGPEGRTSGSIPHAFRNAMTWRWNRSLPKGIPLGFTSVLYTMASMADASGRVRFSGGKAIRISDIAAGARVDEKAARRFIDAAIAAGVVGIEGERKRGRTTLYVLLLAPVPDWGAALHAITSTRRKVSPEAEGKVPWAALEAKFGTQYTELPPIQKFGTPYPELWDENDPEVRDAVPRTSSGRSTPNGSGRSTPNIPGSIQEDPTPTVAVVPQPPVVDGLAETKIIDNQGNEHGWTDRAARCDVCHKPMVARHGRTAHAACQQDTRRTP